jgi:glycerol 2-dehydrogenase (NADP+)
MQTRNGASEERLLHIYLFMELFSLSHLYLIAMTSLYLKLNDGHAIPAVGLGTFQSKVGEVADAVYHALADSKYRHIDCAHFYLNEKEVGEGLKRAIETGRVKREDIFITTKVWPSFHDKVNQSLEESLKNLGVDYVDLVLIHWPVTLNSNGNDLFMPTRSDGSIDVDERGSLREFWHQFEQAKKDGKAKSIGVSNFSVKVLKKLIAEVEIVPAVNQIESHVRLPQQDIVDYCAQNGILVEAHTPFGSTGSPFFKIPEVEKLAKKYGASPATILSSYHVSRGVVVLPKSVTPSRIESNIKILHLDKADLDLLGTIHAKYGLYRHAKPTFGVDLGFPDWDGQSW